MDSEGIENVLREKPIPNRLAKTKIGLIARFFKFV